MQVYIFKWISPVISHQEVEALFRWFNQHLIEVNANPIAGVSQLGVVPILEPDETAPGGMLEGILIQFKTLLTAEAAERLREAIWSELFAELTPGQKPYAASLQDEKVNSTRKELFVFDMDSTVIDQEVIDELARGLGLYDRVAEITEQAMHGKLDFEASLRARCKLLKGMTTYQAENMIPSLNVSPGGDALFRWLRSQNCKTAIVSGGFEFVLKHFQKQLQVDQVYAHHLLSDNDEVLTGEVEAPIIDAKYKQTLAAKLKESYHATAEQTVVVGDGANDMLMMKEGGVSVSFCGKPKLSAVTNTLILNRNLLWLKHLVN